MFVFVIIIQVIVIILAWMTYKDRVLRMSFCILNVAFFCYSCIGIYTYKLENRFYYSYLIALFTLNICFWLGSKLYKCAYVNSNSSRAVRVNRIIDSKPGILKFFAYLYIAIRIFGLFYPELYISYLFKGPNFLYSNLLEATNDNYGTLIGHLLSTIKTILLPFAYLYLSKRSTKAIISFLMFDILSTYLVGRASISRLVLIQGIITVGLVIYARSKTASQKRRAKWILGISVLFSFMLYVFILNLRNGVGVSILSINPIEAIMSFTKSEFFYPRNYTLAEELSESNAYPPWKYWLWLITLPIPKSIISIPGVDTTTSIIYRVFSYYLYGNRWFYEKGGGGMLLSVLGDGIMLYGSTGAFLVIIPFALFISFFLCYIRGIKRSELLYCYAFFRFVVSFRPGVQYALTSINTYVAMILVLFIMARLKDFRWHNTIE